MVDLKVKLAVISFVAVLVIAIGFIFVTMYSLLTPEYNIVMCPNTETAFVPNMLINTLPQNTNVEEFISCEKLKETIKSCGNSLFYKIKKIDNTDTYYMLCPQKNVRAYTDKSNKLYVVNFRINAVGVQDITEDYYIYIDAINGGVLGETGGNYLEAFGISF